MVKKRKVKIVYRTKKIPSVVPTKDESKSIKKEMKELQKQKSQAGSGVKGFLRKMALNKQISEKGNYLRSKDKLRNLSQMSEVAKKQLELEESRAKLQAIRKKSSVSFEGIGGYVGETPKKLNLEDLYK